MRFLGNKESMIGEILKLLGDKKLLDKDYTFFDAFTGTGSVADAVKENFNIVINDKLEWCTKYAYGRIVASNIQFDKLKVNPFEFLNNNKIIHKGFFYDNYAPTETSRMYFTPHNAGRIDYFRDTIEEWKNSGKITNDEYAFLIASLIESVSKVANVAGVYGAFLKKWDDRATKEIQFIPVTSLETIFPFDGKVEIYNEEVENIIEKVECDVLYLDPPYTQNQYGTQYHLLETLVLNDNPSISKITGSRPTGPMRSDWSKEYKAHILFDKVIAKTKAKYIVFSYSTDGIMSKSYIEASLKRYAKPGTYECRKVSYKKYQNWKTKSSKKHYEYLFFIEKEDIDKVVIESPLNYIGSKSKMIQSLRCYIPDIENKTFYDIFGGGFNVGVNMGTSKIVFNDINKFVVDLVESFQKYDTYEYIKFVKRNIKKFNLEPNSKEAYMNIRNYYNSIDYSKRDPRLLYTVILYGFNQQIRFNSDFNFNNPVGMRWFNDKVLEKLVSFSRTIKEKKVSFYNEYFTKLKDVINEQDFVYMDPPYMLTTGSYNDGKRGFEGWSIEHEDQLLKFADYLNSQHVKFMISYVLEHNGEVNLHLNQWLSNRNYSVISIPTIPGRKRKEVVIINYDCPNGNK
ncbi:DNA adenine methylase [Ligilactobacillus ruminis]|uniref:DNA adenine methylase n=1 Tax=Ligilactobacillus ruminis TaxID=1623 RepID=UPI001C01517D|nr:DNA adenine methylase [Ligilactobacillus ruminis]MBT9627026.1 DNA adenine methylase [Ligilactobacillus ruminis]